MKHLKLKTSRSSAMIVLASVVLFSSLNSFASEKEGSEVVNELLEMSLEGLFQVEVVTATLKKQKQSEVPATVYVISSDDIDKFGYRDLADALKHIPGVEISNPDFFLFGGQRGFSGNFSQTLLMINGREMQNLLAGEAFISNQFRLHNVERIEVVMGPASALYGANAAVGVINVITLQQSEWEGGEVSSSIGAFNSRSVDLNYAENINDDSRIYFSLSSYVSDGEDFTDFLNDAELFSRGDEGIRDGTRRLPKDNPGYPYENPSDAISGSFYLDFKQIYAGIEYYLNKSAGGIESTAFVSPTREDTRELINSFAGINGDFFTDGHWSVELEYATEDIESRYPGDYDPGDPDGGPLFQGNFFAKGSVRTRVSPTLDYDFGGNGNVVAGLRFEHSDIGKPKNCRSDDLPGTTCDLFSVDQFSLLDSNKRAIFLQYQNSLLDDNLNVTVGARYDKHDIYGGSFNPRVGVVVKPYHNGVVKIMAGSAFREPNVFELTKNKDLQPVTMESYEISYIHSFLYDFGQVSNQIVYFQNRADDIFQETSTIGGGSEFLNVGERKVQGIENSFKVRWNELNVLFNFSWEQPKDDNLVSDSLNIPKIKANLLLDYTFNNRITVALMNHYVSDVKTDALDTAGNSIVGEIDAFVETDITLSRRNLALDTNTIIGIEVSIRNVFDVDFYHPQVRESSPLQYKQNGREISMEVTVEY